MGKKKGRRSSLSFVRWRKKKKEKGSNSVEIKKGKKGEKRGKAILPVCEKKKKVGQWPKKGGGGKISLPTPGKKKKDISQT